MAFEKFTLVASRGFQPRVSISARGQLGFNQGAINRFDLAKYEYAILFYDKDEQKIAIKPSNDTYEEGAVKLRVNKDNTHGAISAKAFLDYFNIFHKETKRFEASWDDEMQAIWIQINDGEVIE